MRSGQFPDAMQEKLRHIPRLLLLLEKISSSLVPKQISHLRIIRKEQIIRCPFLVL